MDVVFGNGAESTFRASTKVLRRKGLLPSYGAMIGAVPVVRVQGLPRSIKVSYPVFRDHIPPARRCCATARTPSTGPDKASCIRASADATRSRMLPRLRQQGEKRSPRRTRPG
ncbi:hypothetical protein ACFTY7_36485 [Streptomyces sp. NPDC057062]|uniref:hypothetical protein n=1 Tax=Streptomyces sp. NPDC057062 TaxID=3346011 RepID=UPI0036273E9A